MGCNCKAGKESNTYINTKGDEVKLSKFHYTNLIFYSLKIIGFILGLVILPIINIFIIGFMFNMLVLNKEADLKPVFGTLANFLKKAKKKDEDDEDDDFDELTEDDVILLDVDDITEEKND